VEERLAVGRLGEGQAGGGPFTQRLPVSDMESPKAEDGVVLLAGGGGDGEERDHEPSRRHCCRLLAVVLNSPEALRDCSVDVVVVLIYRPLMAWVGMYLLCPLAHPVRLFSQREWRRLHGSQRRPR
jgi:hypothetical protein